MSRTKSPKEVKENFRSHGQTFTGWAKANGFSPQRVLRVVNGVDKGNYGEAHKIAVALGIKPNPKKLNGAILAETGQRGKNVAAA